MAVIGNGLAQRFGGVPVGGPMPVQGTAMRPPVNTNPQPMPVFGSNPPIQRFPVQGAGPMPAPVGQPILSPQPFRVAPPSGTAMPNGMNTLSPHVGNALRRYLGRPY